VGCGICAAVCRSSAIDSKRCQRVYHDPPGVSHLPSGFYRPGCGRYLSPLRTPVPAETECHTESFPNQRAMKEL
jgi:ferredoxin